MHESCGKLHQALSYWEDEEDEEVDLKHVADAFRYGMVAIVEEAGW